MKNCKCQDVKEPEKRIKQNAVNTLRELKEHKLIEKAKGDWNNKIGKQSYKTLYEHDRIMWFVRTAKMYCEQAQKICENVEL